MLALDKVNRCVLPPKAAVPAFNNNNNNNNKNTRSAISVQRWATEQ